MFSLLLLDEIFFLLDKGETSAEAALRELKEETGYVGTVKSTSLASCLSPGLTSESVSVVVVDVNLQDEVNRDPKPNTDEGEYVTKIVVPLSKLGEELDRRENEGDMIFAAVRSLAIGLQMKLPLKF